MRKDSLLYKAGKYITAIAAAGVLAGCSGIQQRAPLSMTESRTLESQLQHEKEIDKNKQRFQQDVSPQSAEEMLKEYAEKKGYNLKFIDAIDGETNEKEPTQMDIDVANNDQATLPENVYFEKETKPASSVQNFDDLSDRELSFFGEKSVEKGIPEQGRAVSFHHPDDKTAYTAVPRAKDKIYPGLLYLSQTKGLESLLNGKEFESCDSFSLKQNGKSIITGKIYDIKEDNKIVKGTAILDYNGYGFVPEAFDKEKLKEEGIKEEEFSHNIEDKALLRFGSDVIPSIGAGFINPGLGGMVFFANISGNNKFTDVYQWRNHTKYHPPKKFNKGDIEDMTNSADSNTLNLIQPVYSDSEFAGFVHYEIIKPQDSVGINYNRLLVSEDNKTMNAVFGDLMKSGLLIGTYYIGKGDSDTDTKYIKEKPTVKEKPTGGITHDGGEAFKRISGEIEKTGGIIR